MGALLGQFGIDWHLLVAQLVNFVLLIAVLRWLAYKPLVAMLNKRREGISQGLRDAADAASAKSEARALATSLEAEARAKAQAIIAQATADAEQQHQQILAQAKAKATAVVAEAKAQLRAEQQAAVAGAEQALAGLVIAATSRVLGNMGPAVQQRLAAQAVAEAMAAVESGDSESE